MGVALTTCTVPGAPTSNRLDGDLIELGMGIHGEPGRTQLPMPNNKMAADSVVQSMLEQILERCYNGSKRGSSSSLSSSVAVLINNLGATPSIELYIIARSVLLQLKAIGINVARVYVGHYMTALEMAGVSVSLLDLDKYPELTEYLDEPTQAPAWVPSHNLSERGKYTVCIYVLRIYV